MKKDNYQRILVAIFLTWIAVMSGCDSKKTLVAGFLEGILLVCRPLKHIKLIR
jgi:hypothetical protein